MSKWSLLMALCAAGVGSTAAETLYNGIVLPEKWPPATSTTADAGPQPVPYLEPEKIPATIPIDVGRQLFVDDFLIELTDLERVYHHPRKYEGNPVLRPETPWEINAPGNDIALPKGGGLWWDVKRQVFRLWYEAGWCREICYAESADGIHWVRPTLDVVPGTNRILPKQRVDSWSVVPDFETDDPDQRWKLFASAGGNPTRSHVYTSSDGFHWKNHRLTGLNEDRSTVHYNPFRKKWIYSLRSNWRGRARNYVEAEDFLSGADWHWPFPSTKPSWTDTKNFTNTVDCVRWLAADDQDVPTQTPYCNRKATLYNFDAVAYESIMLGAFEIHWGPENGKCLAEGLPKITDIQFCYSRDGFHYSRPDRTAAIASERWEAYGKSWDVGYVQPLSNLCVIMGDELWFYYGAFSGDKTRRVIDSPNIPGSGNGNLNGMYAHGAMGFARLRRDGFAGLRTKDRGLLVTRPLVFSGAHLFVNLDAPDGELKTEVLSAEDNRILATLSIVKGNATKMEVGNVSALAGKRVKFRFLLERGELYAFWVSKGRFGASGGYVAGGGRGYNGLKDDEMREQHLGNNRQ